MMIKKRRGIRVAIVTLAVVLVAVIVLIIWKQWEYCASEDFYNSLRGALRPVGACI